VVSGEEGGGNGRRREGRSLSFSCGAVRGNGDRLLRGGDAFRRRQMITLKSSTQSDKEDDTMCGHGWLWAAAIPGKKR